MRILNIVFLIIFTPACLVFEDRPPCYEPDDCQEGEQCVDEVCRQSGGEGEGEGEGE